MITKQKQFIDADTGEIYTFEVPKKKYDILGKKGWRRTENKLLFNLIAPFCTKNAVLAFIINNMNGQNIFDYTQKEVAEILGKSWDSVSKAFVEFVNLGILKKIGNYYVFNTQLISVYGNTETNLYKTIEYGFVEEKKEEKEKSDDEKIQSKMYEIEKLKSEIYSIQTKRKSKNKGGQDDE